MQLPLPIYRKAEYIGMLLLLVLGLIWLGSALSTPRLAPLQLGSYQTRACQTAQPAGKPPLRLLTLTGTYAGDLTEAICAGPAVAGAYSGAEVKWRPRRYLSAEDILQSRYDLFWNRAHLLAGMVPDFLEYYQPLLSTPSYALYWFSRGGAPRMTQAYLENKVVGLLSDTTSQTYYLRPMNALHRAGISLTEHQLRHYPDPHALYRAFATGEIDLISSPRFLADRFQLPYESLLLIDDEVVSGTWYIKNALIGTGVECDLLEALDTMAPMFPDGSRVAEGITCP